MRTSFASLEPETPQYLHLFRKCADRRALCSGRLGTFAPALIGWVCEMASADGCCMPGSSQARGLTRAGFLPRQFVACHARPPI